jgi:hypothetical protein
MRWRVVAAGVTLLTIGALLAGGASASAVLVLQSRGQVAPVGTPALGTLRFGPCGEFQSRGALATNSSSVDVAKFDSTSGGEGGCGEGGPVFSGSVTSDRLTEAGRFTVFAKLTMVTTLNGCEYALRTLSGRFTIPGPTQATVAGKALRTPTSKSTCPERVSVSGVEAKLYDSATNELFEAEL